MRCLWRLWPWAKRKKPTDEENRTLLPGRAILLQPWEMSGRNKELRHRPPSNMQERYVRFGIGGAGNMRKSAAFSSRLGKTSPSLPGNILT
jgi:hypothetical protein